MNNITGEQISVASTTLAVAIAQGRPPRDTTLLGDIFTQIGSTLVLIGDRNGDITDDS